MKQLETASDSIIQESKIVFWSSQVAMVASFYTCDQKQQ